MSGMVHEKRLVTYRTPAWWDYSGAQVFNDKISLLEAGHRGGVFVPLEKREMMVRLGDADDSPVVLVPDRMALVRSTVPQMAAPGKVLLDDRGEVVMSPAAYLTDVGRNYPVMQNKELVAVLDPITRPRTDGGDYWPVESVGVLHHGATLVLSLNMGGSTLAGEDYSNVFGLIENRTGAAMLGMYTKERIVCRNTAIAALEASNFVIRIPHGAHFLQEADAALKLMMRAKKVQTEFDALAERLVNVPLAVAQAEEIAKRVWVEPEKPALVARAEDLAKIGVDTGDLDATLLRKRHQWELERTRMLRRQDLSLYCYERILDDSTLGKRGPNAWAYYQAVLEVSDHETGRGDRALSALVGDRADAKNTALQILAGMANN